MATCTTAALVARIPLQLWYMLPALAAHGMAWYGMVWHGMVEVCEGAPVAVGGWVLTDRHDLAPCTANSLHRETMHAGDVLCCCIGHAR